MKGALAFSLYWKETETCSLHVFLWQFLVILFGKFWHWSSPQLTQCSTLLQPPFSLFPYFFSIFPLLSLFSQCSLLCLYHRCPHKQISNAEGSIRMFFGFLLIYSLSFFLPSLPLTFFLPMLAPLLSPLMTMSTNIQGSVRMHSGSIFTYSLSFFLSFQFLTFSLSLYFYLSILSYRLSSCPPPCLCPIRPHGQPHGPICRVRGSVKMHSALIKDSKPSRCKRVNSLYS